MDQPSIKNNFIYSSIYQIISIILPIITVPYLSRVLEPEGLGIQSFTDSLQHYYILFAVLGTAVYGTREIAQHRKDILQYSALFWEIELMTVFTSFISLLAWCIFILFSTQYKLIYMAMIPNLLASMLDITWLFNGLERFKLTVMRNLVFKVFGIVLIFLIVKTSDDLFKYILISSFVNLSSNASLWFYLPKIIKKVQIDKRQIIKHLKSTIIYFIPSLATSIYTVMDRTLIGLITKETVQNGYYLQAEKIISIAKSITFIAINSVVGVRISYLFALNKTNEVRERINNSMNYILFMGIGCSFGITGIARNFVPFFFGIGYDQVEYMLYIFAPIIIIIGISNCLSSHYFTPSGKRAQSAKYLLIGSCVNLILNLILIPKYGAYGAAIASVIAELIITLLYMAHCDGFASWFFIWKISYRKLMSGILMGATLIGFRTIINSTGFIQLAVQIGVGLVIYIASLILLKDEWFMNNVFLKYKKIT
jgi:O-antigen/teichoic acid export membrane protein